jgi:HAMP domain-containing protein
MSARPLTFNLAEMRQLAETAKSEPAHEPPPDHDPENGNQCQKCRAYCTVPADLEVTPFCNTCAHDVASTLGAAVIELADALVATILTENKARAEAARAEVARDHVSRDFEQMRQDVKRLEREIRDLRDNVKQAFG